MLQPVASKELPGGLVAEVWPLTFGRARIGVGLAGQLWHEESY